MSVESAGGAGKEVWIFLTIGILGLIVIGLAVGVFDFLEGLGEAAV